MQAKYHLRPAFGLLILLLAGCGGHGSEPAGVSQPPPVAPGSSSGEEFGEVQFGEGAVWPDYIPADIPPLPGTINTTMAADSHIRLFYSSVTPGQIEDYLELLSGQGFQLEYLIYIQEGFPDNSEERRQRGEYDAVDITKGEYRLNLSHGEGTAVLDVYTTGFEEAARAGAAVSWPQELAGVAPAPARCELASATPDGSGGFHLSCRREDPAVDQDYLLLLESQGFAVEESFQDNSGAASLVRLRQGDWVMELTTLSETFLTLQVFPDPDPQWPAVFGDLVPVPHNCRLSGIIPSLSEAEDYITCQPETGEVLEDYLEVLRGLGFVSEHELRGQDGEIMITRLAKDNLMVELIVNSPDSLGVRVVREQQDIQD